MDKVARLEYDGRIIELPVVIGSENEIGLDISKLRTKTGMVTLDPGFVNTASCESNITFLDGEKGILRYRGYSIEELAEKADFLEVSYLLIYGNLPTSEELKEFTKNITVHTILNENLKHFYEAFPHKAHPMAILSSVVSALSTYYPENQDSSEASSLAIGRLLGKLPTIAAWAYKKSMGHPFIYPLNSLDYCSNFLRMMFAFPAEPYEVHWEFSKTLNVLFILHADHEQNCSTSTVRMVGSSQAHLFTAISAGINSLWGPLHGGANQLVLEMLQKIHNDGGNVQKFIDMAKKKDPRHRLMGFGHRVYKKFDPRARIIKNYCDKVLDIVGYHDPLLDIAKKLEEVALNDEYFIERSLYPNVDFYSGIIYKALGFPPEMFPVLFALGRAPGWMAHWLEKHNRPPKIGRPRQIYTGEKIRKYVPIEKR